MDWPARRADCREPRLSYHPDNTVAAGLYASVHFRPTELSSGGEVVAALSVPEVRPRA